MGSVTASATGGGALPELKRMHGSNMGSGTGAHWGIWETCCWGVRVKGVLDLGLTVQQKPAPEASETVGHLISAEMLPWSRGCLCRLGS